MKVGNNTIKNKSMHVIREPKVMEKTIRTIVFSIMLKSMPGIMSWKAAKEWLNRKSDQKMYAFMEKYQLRAIIGKNGFREFSTEDVITAWVKWQIDQSEKTIEDFIGTHTPSPEKK